MKKDMFVVEVKKGKKWKFYSDHKDKLFATINAEVQRKAGRSTRIKFNGEVIEKYE